LASFDDFVVDHAGAINVKYAVNYALRTGYFATHAAVVFPPKYVEALLAPPALLYLVIRHPLILIKLPV